MQSKLKKNDSHVLLIDFDCLDPIDVRLMRTGQSFARKLGMPSTVPWRTCAADLSISTSRLTTDSWSPGSLRRIILLQAYCVCDCREARSRRNLDASGPCCSSTVASYLCRDCKMHARESTAAERLREHEKVADIERCCSAPSLLSCLTRRQGGGGSTAVLVSEDAARNPGMPFHESGLAAFR